MAITRIPSATYRLQFNGQFRFKDAEALVPYLNRLGITDLYASPILQSRRGSNHGYDVTNPARINPEIGSEEDLEALTSKLRQHSMGLLLDIVPNHLAASDENPWWMDVLENGPASTYATFFDIDWHPPNRILDNKVLLPLLARPYAQALENCELTLVLESQGFFIQYSDIKLPVAPKSYAFILRHRLDDLKRNAGPDSMAWREYSGILAAVTELPERVSLASEAIGERRQLRESIKERLWSLYSRSPEIKTFLDENLRLFNGKKRVPGSFVLLDELLTDQAYILSFWQTANEEINYRRFFTITDLVGMRVEDPLVFDATHAAVLRLVEKGAVTGLRIDHIDGLRDPLGYLRKLQERLKPDDAENRNDTFYVIVEKILSHGEELCRNWPVFGTTGYDFLNILNGIFVDAKGHEELVRTYGRFVPAAADYDGLVYAKKMQIMETLLAVEMRSLGHHLTLLAEQDRYARDLPLDGLAQVLIKTTACLPVYRTYVRNFDVTAVERRFIQEAIDSARRRSPGLNAACFDFLEDVLSLREKTYLPSAQQEARLNFTMRWQQFSGPIMAKGFEDTTLYIYNPLVSLNEVGGSPHNPNTSAAAFHQFCKDRKKYWPHALNATSTHDTKRSEDVRARINVLSELSAEWKRHFEHWVRWNNSKKTVVNGRRVPDLNEEILLYQTMLGAWPFEEKEIPRFKERLQAYMMKATREAMVHTKWSRPNVKHEKAFSRFIEAIMQASKSGRFLKDFLQFQQKISFYGALNSLAQVTIKVCAPGVPDFYQGSELWDLRLVDPDNRGPVDFGPRIRLLEEFRKEEEERGPVFFESLIQNWKDGRIKLFLIYKLLNFRKTHCRIFEEGDYLPLPVYGGNKENVCAFLRHKGKSWSLTVVPRFITRLTPVGVFPHGRRIWGGSYLQLTAEMPHLWRNILTQDQLTTIKLKDQPALPLADLLCRFPVAVLGQV